MLIFQKIKIKESDSDNNINLNKVYVLTSRASASSSEMIINSLKAYIDVVQIGDTTVGKSQASQIIYDSSNLSRTNVNPSHTYALLPLIAITVNKNNTVNLGVIRGLDLKTIPVMVSENGTIGFQIASPAKEKCLHYKLHSKNSVTE